MPPDLTPETIEAACEAFHGRSHWRYVICPRPWVAASFRARMRAALTAALTHQEAATTLAQHDARSRSERSAAA